MSEDKKLLHSSSSFYKDKEPAFVFTNENVAAYLSRIGNLSGKSVLSVAASGDHAFQAYSYGASYVDTFDINSDQALILELKTKMIRGLSYDNFMDYFFSPTDIFNPKIINGVFHSLSRSLQLYILKNYMTKNMFRDYSKKTVEWVSYLHDRHMFDMLKNKLPASLNFVHTDISGLSASMNKKYDLILLSNICQAMYPDKYSYYEIYTQFYNNVLRPLADKNLNPGGMICFDYIFSLSKAENVVLGNILSGDILRVPRCPGHDMAIRQIPSVVDSAISDIVVTMSKTR